MADTFTENHASDIELAAQVFNSWLLMGMFHEDYWISLTDTSDLNIFINTEGRLAGVVYPVHDRKTVGTREICFLP